MNKNKNKNDKNQLINDYQILTYSEINYLPLKEQLFSPFLINKLMIKRSLNKIVHFGPLLQCKMILITVKDLYQTVSMATSFLNELCKYLQN